MDKGRRGHEFQIGLTMSGAISAGAYTAGVLDFLIEALDAWEDARNGPDADTVPGHRVGIKVMSGASAGAITAAIGAIALVDAEPDGKRKAPGAYVKEGFTYSYYMPKLYETWVVKPTFVAETNGTTDFLTFSDLDAPDPATSFFTTSGVPSSGAGWQERPLSTKARTLVAATLGDSVCPCLFVRSVEPNRAWTCAGWSAGILQRRASPRSAWPRCPASPSNMSAASSGGERNPTLRCRTMPPSCDNSKMPAAPHINVLVFLGVKRHRFTIDRDFGNS